MNSGRNLLLSFDQNGKHYDLIIIKNTEIVVTWIIQLFEGIDTWKDDMIFGQPIIVLDETYNTDFPQTPDGARKKVQVVVDSINIFLKNKFIGGIPMTWIEQIEAIINKIIFFRDENGIPQVKIS